MAAYEHAWDAIDNQSRLYSLADGADMLLTAPANLWHLYVEYLWHYDRHAWIMSASATFKLLAMIIMTPFVILSMLDVGAYVIARTLGVIETTRASTSDIKRTDETPTESDESEMDGMQVDIVELPRREEAFSENAAVEMDPMQNEPEERPSRFGARLEIPTPHYPYIHKGLNSYGPEVEACFFSPSDERQLELGGALLSSPTPSRQGSPALDRRQRMQSLTAVTLSDNAASPDAKALSDETFKIEAPSTNNSYFQDEISDDNDKEKDNAALADQNLRRRVAGADGDAGSET